MQVSACVSRKSDSAQWNTSAGNCTGKCKHKEHRKIRMKTRKQTVSFRYNKNLLRKNKKNKILINTTQHISIGRDPLCMGLKKEAA